MKIIAFYLPQFHEIPENNEWWGKGFTEWTNVKKARPCFRNQIQPKVPLNDNYYNLMDKNTVKWQTDLMNEYNVYGFCYFHYWFSTNKKILEKPAENLLKWKDINQRFCFAWANVTWARTWTAHEKNATTWVSEDNSNKSQTNNGILLKQEYGNKEDWRAHYLYLLNFFKDKRYIKEKNKPMFLIYQLDSINCANEMFACFNDWAKEDGFDGIHIVSMNQMPTNKYVEAVAKYDRFTTYDIKIVRKIINKILKILKLNTFPEIYDYERIWRGMVEEKYSALVPTYPGGFVNYDDTPRRGKRAIFIENSSPEIFEKYIKMQIEKAKSLNVDYLFLDAWNEWGEGNYLEPDKENGYKYLEAVKRAQR